MSATATTIVGGPGQLGPRFFSAAAAPTVDNDALAGHFVGDEIYDTVAGVTYKCQSSAAGAAVWKSVAGAEQPPTSGTGLRAIEEVNLGNGSIFRRAFLEEALVFAAAAAVNLTTQIPANSRVIAASLNLDTAVVLSTATKLGFGTAADPDGLLLSSATVTKNTKANSVAPTLTSFSTATTLAVTAVDNAGAAAGTVTSGTVRARVLFEYITSIGDAP